MQSLFPLLGLVTVLVSTDTAGIGSTEPPLTTLPPSTEDDLMVSLNTVLAQAIDGMFKDMFGTEEERPPDAFGKWQFEREGMPALEMLGDDKLLFQLNGSVRDALLGSKRFLLFPERPDLGGRYTTVLRVMARFRVCGGIAFSFQRGGSECTVHMVDLLLDYPLDMNLTVQQSPEAFKYVTPAWKHDIWQRLMSEEVTALGKKMSDGLFRVRRPRQTCPETLRGMLRRPLKHSAGRVSSKTNTHKDKFCLI